MPATAVVPARDELARRIAQADPERVVPGLYPGILKMAGRTLTGAGVVVMLSNAIAEHTRGPDGDNTSPPMYELLLMKLLPDFVHAIVDDEQVRADALAMLEKSAGPGRGHS
ncbi:hypothetical protein [Streptomyces sp. NPDC050485]|uniref:hypothetical protein n=1 Tax=Streptomyces sp. NPDC050485 TaxID=3365617 RepID=UPI0037914467